MQNKNNRLKVGSVLNRVKFPVTHQGIYLGEGQVIHTSPTSNISIVPFEEFADNQKVTIDNSVAINEDVLMQRVQDALSKTSPYSLLSENCQHLVKYLTCGEKQSHQLQLAVFTAIFGALVNVSRERNPLNGLLLGGIFGTLLYTLVKNS